MKSLWLKAFFLFITINFVVFAGMAQTLDETEGDEQTSTATEPEMRTQQARIYNDGRTVYATSATKFRIDASDDLSEPDYIEYSVDNGDFQRYSEPFSINQDGKHTIVYRGVDKVGNLEKDQSFEVVIDNTPPKVYIPNSVSFVAKDDQKHLSAKSKISLMASDELSGVKRIQYQIDGGPYQDYSQPFQPKQEGTVQINYKAEDNLGNTTKVNTLKVMVDGKAPTVEIKPDHELVVMDGKNYSKKNNNFNVTASDDGSGVVRILIKATGDEEFREYTGPVSFTSSGEKTLAAKAIDRVGNESQLVKLSFVIDDNAPKTKLTPVTD